MEQLLYSYETEQERLELAYQMRERFVRNHPNLTHWASVPTNWEAWAEANPDKTRMDYQLWLYDILEVCDNDLDTHIGPLCIFVTSDNSCHAWVGRCKSPNEFKH